ncbi:predicted protein [Sclerotinia sclerotiorum 1980 UF-70]|uniref:Uncharacterized protein n=1 Tax=Sclerotinia sclerotiorum (strain ATCC 18683 / 1980 / Ss-1) TaxID=665079 RepID=A7F0I7_SCLS1|nr:predicted protein [Sclerotinia sclerotiorum 1980 UF-70]EDN95229.1 predicted protein [Sclerotinia sclerotiorum 1980 UF-70]
MFCYIFKIQGDLTVIPFFITQTILGHLQGSLMQYATPKVYAEKGKILIVIQRAVATKL